MFLQVSATDDFGEIDISSDNDEEDHTDDGVPSRGLAVGTIIALFEADPYLACPMVPCNNKKLTTVLQNETYVMKCSTCSGYYRAGTANQYLRIVVLMKTEENENKKVTMFLPTIKKLFIARGLDFEYDYDKTNVMESILKIIPYEVRYALRGNTVVEVVAKRAVE